MSSSLFASKLKAELLAAVSPPYVALEARVTALEGGAPAPTPTPTPSDTTPSAFSFTDVANAAPSTVYESNTVTIGGLSAGVAVAVSVAGATYSKNGAAYTSAAGTAVNGDTFKVRHTSSANASTATNTTLTIGGVSDTFTTVTAAVSVGAPFTFTTIPIANRVAWYDFTDQATLTLSGGALQAISDKYGILPALAAPTTGERPAWSATALSGTIAGADFTNNRLKFVSPTALANALDDTTGEADLAVFVFGRYKGGNTEDGRLLSMSTTAAGRMDFDYPGFVAGIAPDDARYIYSPGSAGAATPMPVGSVAMFADNFAVDGWQQTNGVEVSTFAGTAVPLDECGQLAIGANVNGPVAENNFRSEFNNFVYTHVLLLKNVSRELGMQIAGRFAHMHGYTSLLPADHPYKTVAPKADDVFNTATLTLSKTSFVEDEAQTIAINGAPTGSTIALVSGALPSGMTLNSSARTITGTVSAQSTATFTLELTVPGAVNKKRFTFTLSVLVGGAANQYTGVNLAGAEFGHGTLANVPGEFGGSSPEYMYASNADIDYFIGTKDLKLVRLPILWERVQNALNGALTTADMAEIDRIVTRTTQYGAVIALDMHNYMRRWMGTELRLIADNTTDPVLHRGHLADVWGKIANRYKNNPLVWFNLMNEPYGMADSAVVGIQNAAIVAIRATGAENKILVSGNSYSGARHFRIGNEAYTNTMLGIVDTGNNWAWDLHQYADDNYSGNDTDMTPVGQEGTAAELMAATTAWLRSVGQKGHLGEYGGADNDAYEALVRGQLAHMQANSDVWIGSSYWAAGQWWGNYSYSVQPGGSAPNYVDKGQLAWIKDYTPAGVVVAPADTTPNLFTFAPATNANVSTVLESNEQQISGLTGATAISVTGGSWAKRTAAGAYGAWQTTAGTVSNTEFVKVRHTTSASFGAATNTSLTIGTLTRTFTSTTVTEAVVPSTFVATGGTVTEDATYRYYTFANGSTINVTTGGDAHYLVVGGGGAGAYGHFDAGGGGGAGGLKTALHTFAAGSHAVTVGAGGSAGSDGVNPTAGGASSIAGVVSVSGGGVGGGGNGASGGGGNGDYQTSNTSGVAITGEGFVGGAGAGGNQGNQRSGGGGGGAGGTGGAATQADAGAGGAGVTVWGGRYAGGGGGSRGGNRPGALGGSEIGGKGGFGGEAATAGATGTGSGGGGVAAEGDATRRPGAGGSGTVRLRVTK